MKLPDNDYKRKSIHLENQWKLFPKATVALSKHIQDGADKYCDGEVKWDRSKSPDEVASILRHLFEYVGMPSVDSAVAIAWRGMALLEKTIEAHDYDPYVYVGHGEDLEDGTYIPAMLCEFLDSEGMLEEYLDNLDDDVDFEDMEQDEYIFCAFAWDFSPSGKYKWFETHCSWLQLLKELDEN